MINQDQSVKVNTLKNNRRQCCMSAEVPSRLSNEIERKKFCQLLVLSLLKSSVKAYSKTSIFNQNRSLYSTQYVQADIRSLIHNHWRYPYTRVYTKYEEVIFRPLVPVFVSFKCQRVHHLHLIQVLHEQLPCFTVNFLQRISFGHRCKK